MFAEKEGKGMQQRSGGWRCGSAGFTVVELAVVVAILAIIAIFLAPRLLSTVDASRYKEALSGAGAVQAALERYAADNDEQYPKEVSALSDLQRHLAAYIKLDERRGPTSRISRKFPAGAPKAT
jgi:prepilin-type N-terminal cleavage/methylation domain-containing protein